MQMYNLLRIYESGELKGMNPDTCIWLKTERYLDAGWDVMVINFPKLLHLSTTITD